MPERWRLIVDAPLDGATNMARDEALATVLAHDPARPTLRLYAWKPACLSLGRFQRSREADQAACARAGVTIVRRPSGGRALLHDHELTYAVIAPERHPQLGDESILASYRQISLALLAGLHQLGVVAELTPVARQRAAASSAACFDAPASYELTVGGRKLAGSAQTRQGGVILQHGAIPLTPHADRLAALLLHPPSGLGQKMIALSQAAGRAVTFDELAQALITGFGTAWGIELEPGTPTPAELALEQQLRARRYALAEWTFGR